jgi:hypothetical protein
MEDKKMTIYTSKKTGATYTLTNEEVQVSLNGDSKTIYTLTSTEDPTDSIHTTESVLKRWYKKSVEVDFTVAEEKPVEKPKAETKEAAPAPKAKKQRKVAAPKFNSTEVISIEEARSAFKDFSFSTETNKVYSKVFHPRNASITDTSVTFIRRRIQYVVNL